MESEIQDGDCYTADELIGNLADMRFLNRISGVIGVVLRKIDELRRRNRLTALRLLDAGCGSGDIPIAIEKHYRVRSFPIEIAALDNNPIAISEANRLAGAQSNIQFIHGDLKEYPDMDQYDLILLSHVLHHFHEAEQAEIIAQLHRRARWGVMIYDLKRSFPAYWAARLSTGLISHNRLTRNDGPLSALRSLTPADAETLMRKAKIDRFAIENHPLRYLIMTQH